MNILRYYNQNKKSLWIIATIIIIIIVVIQAANFMVKLGKEKEEEEKNNQPLVQNKEDYKENPDISVEIKEEQVKEEKELIIDQFIRYCNSGKVQEAYNLLSTSCKNNIYPTLEKFINNYYNTVYKSTKLYSKESYYGGTYKIKLYNDALASGKVSGSYIEDYFTIVKENEETKLNISRFIKEENLDILEEGRYLTIQVKKKIVYKECVEYVLDIKNLTDKDIMLDSLRNPKSAYLVSANNLNFYSALSEKAESDLIIYAGISKTIRVKFNMEYNSTNVANRIVFTDIILDKKQYDLTEKKKDFDKIVRMDIKLNS